MNLLILLSISLVIQSYIVSGKEINKPIFPKKHLLNTYGTPFVSRHEKLPKDEWFIQDLDHFNPSETTTWKQRYFTNDKYFTNESRVIFLMIGGEGEASPKWMVAGQWIEMAKKFGALCFQLEHRFYGKSYPTKDMGTKNLAFLHSEQALADLANFIITMNDNYKFDSSFKWILFGGSYPGSLAAWMRLKYPHLVTGSVSSSGPLLAKTDFMEFYQIVVDALRTSSDSCVDAIKEGFTNIENILANEGSDGKKRLDKLFRLCDSLADASKLDYSNFYESLASNFAGVVQYNKDNRIGGNTKVSNITIDVVCRLMTDSAAGSAVGRLATVNSLLLDANDQKCFDYKYDNMINSYRNASWGSTAGEGGRQWMYQTCNEFGFYQTSGGEPDVFSNNFPLDFFIQQCIDIFGAKFNSEYVERAVRRTNMMYGALDIPANKIVYVHGSIDPWHALGIYQTRENGAPALYITGTAHCANMYPSSDQDPPTLKEARLAVVENIELWLEN